MNAIVDAAAGFIIASMAGLGIGGGGLLVIYLTLVLKLEQLPAQGLNLLFFVIASGSSLFIHAGKRKLDIKLILIISASGIIGALIGMELSDIIHPELIKKFFGGLLLLSGAVSLFKK